MNTLDLKKWILNQKKKNLIKTTKVNILDTLKWTFNKKEIHHNSKAFFSIVPFEFENNFKKKWYQPLIIQKEIGILGIIKKKIFSKDLYLLQAKVEPGNINGMQLSPTVQATKSNYLQKHGGKKTNYLEYFIKKNFNKKIISNFNLSEQGSRYLDKLNKNILIELNKEKLLKKDNYVWLTKENLKYLLNKKNLLNMDTISVISCSIKKNYFDKSVNKFSNLLKKLDNFKKKYKIKKKVVSFNKLFNWKIFKDNIVDIKRKYFTIFFLKVETNSREIKKWYQPIISDHYISLNGFLIKDFNQTRHYLMKLVLEPGFSTPKFTSTVSIKNFKKTSIYKKIRFVNFFLKKKNLIKFTNSDEGGRFFKNETLNLVYNLKDEETIKIPSDYIWVSQNQVIALIKKNLLTIEARNLFGCFNIDNMY